MVQDMNLEAIEENVKTLFNRVEKLEEKVLGNGQPGLVVEVAGMKSDMTTIKRMLLAVFTVCIGIFFKLLMGD